MLSVLFIADCGPADSSFCLCCRSPSVLLADPPYPQHHAGRQGDGHRPTQSMLPAYHHSHAAHAHTLSFPIQDQTLHQLVRSRTLRDPLGSPTCLEGSPQGSTQPHPPHEGRLKAGKPQQAASPKLSKRQSGNPFASDNSAQGVDTDLEQQGSSSLSHVVSGNPFVTMSEMSWEGSRLVSRQDEAAGEVCAGQSPVASRLNGMLCLEAVQERGVIAGSSVQEHAQPSNQQALPRCVGSSAQLAASANPLKDPEMSPLQNGLIRCTSPYSHMQPFLHCNKKCVFLLFLLLSNCSYHPCSPCSCLSLSDDGLHNNHVAMSCCNADVAWQYGSHHGLIQ